MRWFIIIFLTIKVIAATPTPIVLWHGMGDTCCLSFSLGGFKKFLENRIPGVYVYSIRIGNNTVEDFESGYFVNPNKQVKYVCKKLASDPKLKDGFNAIGFSQGSQFLRAVIQRCGHIIPRVRNFVSLGGQHQGVYGLPHCGAMTQAGCNALRELLNYAAYVSWVQNGLVQATYWHDPLDEKTYKEKSIFLADINNEKTINQTYIDNMKKLEHFIMVKFSNDTMVVPNDSSWFMFYKAGQQEKIQPLEESDIYVEDRVGLKALDKAKKLVFMSLPTDHLQFPQPWFDRTILQPYLLN